MKELDEKWKICSRGHRYQGAGPCPVCWPGRKREIKENFKTIDDYIKTFPVNVRSILEKIRRTIRKASPEATEAISYRMPAFKLNGKNLVFFAGFKNHIGFYPIPSGIKAFKKELSVYKRGKGSVQFPLDKSIPYDLVEKIVVFRTKENVKKQK
jgi:uncharacterized protein YdhG (YjbR/CyaY superfamily)